MKIKRTDQIPLISKMQKQTHRASTIGQAQNQSPNFESKFQMTFEKIGKQNRVYDSGRENFDRGVFVFQGFELFSLSEGEGQGLESTKFDFPQASMLSWKGKEQALNKIKDLPEGVPIVLIGHSLGGDTAVKLARELEGERAIDLLVTIDSWGLDNDLIPKNVIKNLNFIGSQDPWLNDGPNLAVEPSQTMVLNELRSEKHTELDNSFDIQEKIFEEIEALFESHSQLKSLQNFLLL